MNPISKFCRLCGDRKMWAPFFRWVVARIMFEKPRVILQPGISVGEWISFSEYYSYYAGVTAAELQFLQTVRNEVPAGKCVAFDVGGNVGLFTCAMLGAGFSEIHTFEPIPDTFVRLKRNAARNHGAERCMLNCIGVGAERGIVSFAENTQAPGVSRMATAATPFAYKMQQVPVISIDEYCSLFKIQTIHLAKIDVEGMEELVLRGAKEMLGRRAIKKLLIEISPVNQPHVGLHVDGLLGVIKEFGYETRKLREDGSVGERYDFEYLRNCYQENVVLVPVQ